MRNIYITAVALIFALITAGATYGKGNKTEMHVSARVLPVTQYKVLHQESSITVSEEDIKRGFIDVQNALVLSVTTNSPDGYLLTFFIDYNNFSGLTLSEGINFYNIDETESEIHMPSEGKEPVTKNLTFRLHLLPDAKPGTYQWPATVMISAL
jgi:hypothetical protein